MTPQRWFWMVTQSDASNRPVVLPHDKGLYNAAGSADNQNNPQGYVGNMLGLPIMVDPNIPSNLGAGTNQDVIIVAKMDDLWLWEGNLKAQAFEQTFAQNMSLFVRLYNYMAFQPGRYPKAVSTINGTGLISPAGF